MHPKQTPSDVFGCAFERFEPGSIAVCTSCQVKRVAVLDLTGHINRQVCVLTIDTCRMPEETYLIIDYARHRHHLAVEVFAPDADYVADLVRSNWPNPICQSVPLRMACCEANKSVPLARVV